MFGYGGGMGGRPGLSDLFPGLVQSLNKTHFYYDTRSSFILGSPGLGARNIELDIILCVLCTLHYMLFVLCALCVLHVLCELYVSYSTQCVLSYLQYNHTRTHLGAHR